MNRLLRGALPAVLLGLAACGARTPAAMAPLPDRPWTVLPGDEIRVKVYREPELNGQFVVNSQGEVLLPGLGRLTVGGLTPDSLTTVISAGYAERLINSMVDVGIIRMVPVLGEVKSPGVYSVEPTMTIQQLVAKAGGVKSSSTRAITISLLRGRDGSQYSIAADLRLDRLPLDEGDAIVVYDPDPIARWAPWIDTLNRFGGLLTIMFTIITFTKK